jgi:hypothetical protein
VSSILGRDAPLAARAPSSPVSAEFNWWLLIVGLVAGGALTWVVLADSTRREREIGDQERAAEAAWISRTLDDQGLDPDRVARVLAAHRRYLGFPPPDALVAPDELAPDDELGAQGAEPPAAPPAIEVASRVEAPRATNAQPGHPPSAGG